MEIWRWIDYSNLKDIEYLDKGGFGTVWKAKWIEPGYTEDEKLRPSPYFRKQFTAEKKISSATVYITAHGLYEAQLNGKKIGDAFLTPGWTSYNKRLQYQVYNVTEYNLYGWVC